MSRLNRREMLKKTAIGVGAGLSSTYLGCRPEEAADHGSPAKLPAVVSHRSPNSQPSIAVIGCTNQAYISINDLARQGERMVAFCDVDDKKNMAKGKAKLAKDYPDYKVGGIQEFYDYRKMLDEISSKIDAVFVCIPDHHHATAAMRVIKSGLPVYVEKPLAHSIADCRALAAAAKQYDVTTQLGNQGHSKEGVRVLCEYLWAGAIGNVIETHHWAPTGRGGTGGRPPPARSPKGCTGTSGSGRPSSATITPTCTLAVGGAGGSSATARWATGAATIWTVLSGPSTWATPPASRPLCKRVAATNVIRWST